MDAGFAATYFDWNRICLGDRGVLPFVRYCDPRLSFEPFYIYIVRGLDSVLHAIRAYPRNADANSCGSPKINKCRAHSRGATRSLFNANAGADSNTNTNTYTD
jgi:hypothetical protein